MIPKNKTFENFKFRGCSKILLVFKCTKLNIIFNCVFRAKRHSVVCKNSRELSLEILYIFPHCVCQLGQEINIQHSKRQTQMFSSMDMSSMILLFYYLMLQQNDTLVASLYMQWHFSGGRGKKAEPYYYMLLL